MGIVLFVCCVLVRKSKTDSFVFFLSTKHFFTVLNARLVGCAISINMIVKSNTHKIQKVFDKKKILLVLVLYGDKVSEIHYSAFVCARR